MAVQKSKKTRSKRGMRRSHDSIMLRGVSVDKKSGAEHMYHHITPCGHYRGKKILIDKKQQEKD